MQTLADRRIVLGLTGSIAAYKAVWLARLLVEAGAEVQAVMTSSAQRFVGPMTLAAITGNPVRDDLWDQDAELAMGHIELARWAELMVVAPASADTIARLASGRADDLLSSLCLATEAPLLLAPAMNYVMWAHPATRVNVETLQARGATLIGPDDGALAERESGIGRMVEPEAIRDAVVAQLAASAQHSAQRLAGQTILITAGPTIEAIDPVRYITNHSSGRMGFAIAAACAAAGGRVILVAGPVTLATPAGVERENVQSAGEMHAAVRKHIDDADIFIGAAAVADYTPAEQSVDKVKKSDADMTLALTRTTDIITEVAREYPKLVTLGFAAETGDIASAARAKRRDKGLTMVAGNRVGPNHAFGRDDNELFVASAADEQQLGPAPKHELAATLVDMLADCVARR